jgi:hypothetical protein
MKRTRERNADGNMVDAGASKKVRCKFMVIQTEIPVVHLKHDEAEIYPHGYF